MTVSPAFRAHPSKLFVETTKGCNLRCRMCVKEIWDKTSMEGTLATEAFAALEPVFPHLEALVLNGVGESLLDPRLEDFIRLAKGKMKPEGWVGIQTNGLLLNGERAVSLAWAGLDRVCVSVDALSGAKRSFPYPVVQEVSSYPLMAKMKTEQSLKILA